MNLCFEALDRRVVRGEADSPALEGERPMHVARLLEEVAALAGLFRGVGIVAGHAVGVRAADRRVELLTLLACLRIGATAVELRDGRLAEHRPLLVVTDARLDLADHVPTTVLLHGVAPEDDLRDLDWEIGMRAGRTDPAPSVELPEHTLAWVLDTPVTLADALTDPTRYGAWLRDLNAGVPIDPAAQA